jgi:hypothetical protein
MKFNKFSIAALAFVTTAFVGCERELETEGLTKKITYYPVFELEGDEEIVIHAGDAFTLPSATATEGGSEIPVTTTITGSYFTGPVSSLDPNVPDVYTVNYSATNQDGFSGSATRSVTVLPQAGDLVNSIEGVYKSTVVRNGVVSPQYTDLTYVYISKIGDNTYQISDVIAGYYDYGRAYGPDYAGVGATITANNIATNDFSFGGPVGVGAFGGNAEITSFEVNPITKTIKMESEWDAGYSFEITLTQVPL